MSTAMLKNDLHRIPVMDKFQRHLKYYERQQRLLKAKETQSALITQRKHILQAANRATYQNEYNRLVGALSVNGHRGETNESRKQKIDRMKELVSLGAVGGNENKFTFD